MSCNLAYRITADQSFSWESFGDSDAGEVLVFDDSTGTTHLIDGTAHAVYELLLKAQAALTAEDLTYLLVGDAGDFDQGLVFVSELLAIMARIGLLAVSAEACPRLSESGVES